MNDAVELTPSRRWVALVVLTFAVTLLAVDGTVLALALPSLSETLEPSATQLLWIGDVYSFALAGLLVTMGNLADKIGRKRLLLIGAAGFGLASAVAAFVDTPELLIGARALLGVSGATIMPSTLSIVRNIFSDPAERRRAIAIWSAGAGGGAALGPIVGGALLEQFWWGSVFLINIPVMVIVVGFGAVLLPESRNPNAGRIDLLSSALSIAAIVPVVFAIKHTTTDGIDVTGVSVLVVGLIAGWSFVGRQRRIESPMLDVRLFQRPAFAGAVGANAMAIFALSGLIFFFSQYLQIVRGLNPLAAGLTELPATIASIVVVVLVGVVARKAGVGGAVGLGLLMAAAGMVGLAAAEGLPGLWGIVIAMAIVGLGIGLAMALSTDAVVASAPRAQAGAAASVAETSYELGIAMGIAVLGSLTNALYRAQLPPLPGVPADVHAAAMDSVISGVRAMQDRWMHFIPELNEAFTTAMQMTSLVGAALLAVAGLVAWRLLPFRLEDEGSENTDGEVTAR